MTTYKIVKTDGVEVCILRNGADSIPFDPANTDYQAYLAWLSAGNQPLSADADAEGNEPIPAEPEPQPE